MGRNYYATLEVARGVNDYELKNAYRRLALKFHPQRTGAQNEGQFREIAEAYTVLSDSVKRAKFDQYGEEGLKNGTLAETEYKGYQYVGDPMQLCYVSYLYLTCRKLLPCSFSFLMRYITSQHFRYST